MNNFWLEYFRYSNDSWFYSFIILMLAPKNTLTKNRIAALLMLLLLGAAAVFYGRITTVLPTSSTSNDYSNMLLCYILSVILATLGWGLIIAYSENFSVSSLLSTLLANALTTLIQPPICYFYNYYLIGQTSASNLFDYGYTTFSNGAAVSLMIALCCLSGRLSMLQLIIVIFLFNCGYSLSFCLAIYLNPKLWNVDYFDNNGGYFIYLFSGCFALTTSSIINCNAKSKKDLRGTKHSVAVGLVGTGFIFATFPFTDYSLIKSLSTVSYRPLQSPLNTYFSMTASVITTFMFSVVFNKGTIQVRELLIGVISGGVIISSVVAYIDNIGACIAVGAFAGFLSSFWLRIIHPSLNSNKVYDHMGITGPITFNAIIGGVGLAPLLFQTYRWIGTFPSIILTAITGNQYLLFQLLCAGLSMTIGLLLGLITGSFCLVFRNSEDDYQDEKLVSSHSGLYFEKEQKKPQSKVKIQLQPINEENQSGHTFKFRANL